MLVGARVAQGVAAAILTPGSLAIIEASFAPEDRGRAIGAWSGLGGVATAIGPFLGGWLVDAASWRWIFLLNVPLGAAVVAVGGAPRARVARPARRRPRRRARRRARRPRPRRAHARADPGVVVARRRRPRRPRRVRARRAPDGAPARAAGAVLVAHVQRDEHRDAAAVRRARRRVLPPRPRPAGSARLHAAAGRRGDGADHAGDAPAVGPRRRPRRAHRPAHPDDRRPARRRRRRCSC